MHSLPLIGLGMFFALAGLALFAFTLRREPAPAAPRKKSDERLVAARQKEVMKLRIAAAICVALGATLMVLS